LLTRSNLEPLFSVHKGRLADGMGREAESNQEGQGRGGGTITGLSHPNGWFRSDCG